MSGSGTRIVVDSTADLGDLAREWGVTVAPLTVTFGDESFADGVDITPHTFFAKLAAIPTLPTTSQPTPGALDAIYRGLLSEGTSGIVSIHVSAKLSGTYSTAAQVAQMLSESGVTTPIELVDSEQASLGMQFGIQAAVEAARAGQDAATVAERAREVFARSTVFLVADDLGYLRRGGRIGAAQRVAGALLSVKPIITLRDGVVVALENPRTRRRAYERLAEHVQEMAPVEAVIVGQSTQEYGDELEAAVRQVYSGPIRRMWPGAVVGTHVGPGAAGLAVLKARG